MKKTAVVVSTAFVAGSLHALPARADSNHRPRPHDREKIVKGHRLGVKPRSKDPAVKGGRARPKISWPKAGSAELAVPSGRAQARAGGMPIWISAPASQPGTRATPATAPARVRVKMLGHSAARKAGAGDLLFTVSTAGATGGSVGLEVDYSAFGQAFGGAYASRLTLVRLPGCVLTTPRSASCRRSTPVKVRNDSVRRRLVAEVSAPAGLGTGTARGVTATTQALQPAVLAVTASSTGASGDYKATSLSPSATWNVGAQSGDFSWSHPLRVPPVPGNLGPQLTVGYSSGSVDGRTGSTNNQPSWLGEGFEMWPGYIQRSYKPCAEDGAPKDQYGNEPGDQCWGYDNATMTLNGKGGELIPDGSNLWRLKDDDGTRIQKLTDTGKGNGDNDGEYWRVTTTDGTQYYFGANKWSSASTETKSTWTVPVFGNGSGEPCHKSTGFSDSWCQQAWRWNLDYVVDPHGNAIAYYYVPETNHYGRNLKPGDPTPYERGGYLRRIDYGLRSDNMLAANSPARVDLTVAERCLPDASFDCGATKIGSNPEYWWDVPWDQNCDSGQECKDGHGSTSPTFWSRKWLDTVSTKIWDSAANVYRPVESWIFKHDWGKADADRDMLLQSIQHVGEAGGNKVTLPPVTFRHTPLANRIDKVNLDILTYYKYRLATIYDESGGQLDINYTGEDCGTGDLPTPETNTRRCYPNYWQPAGKDNPIQDWFHKYLVAQVVQTDRTGWAAKMITNYSYQGGAAWHFDDDDGLTKEKYKTWSQWRGYGKVIETSGGEDAMVSQTEHLYFRGMDGDRKNASGGTKQVTVPDGEGNTYADDDWRHGFELKTAVLDKPQGTAVTKTLQTPWHHQTASRTRSWGTTTANLVDVDTTWVYTTMDDGTPRKTKVVNRYETATGQKIEVDDQGDLAVADDDRCTVTAYAQNTAAWMMRFPSEVRVTRGVPCGDTPTDYRSQLISHEKTLYDGQAWKTPPKSDGGNVTEVDKVITATTAGETFVPAVKHAYDPYGRATTSVVTNAVDPATPSTWIDQTTETAYTESGGLTTKVIVTTPPATPSDPNSAQTTVQTFDPAYGLPTAKTDAGGKTTNMRYDGLGRTTKVWLPNRSTSQTPNYEYGYNLTDGQITSVATSTLRNDGTQKTGYELYDGLLRLRQTQSPGPGGGRVVADTFYNSIGKPEKKYAPYYAQNAPSGVLFGVDTPGNVETQSRYTYDGLGRTTVERVLSGNGDKPELWRTTATYGGDWVRVQPPNGAATTTSWTDAQGRTVRVRKDRGNLTSEDSTFTYNPVGKLDSITGPGGKTWSYTYDLRGRKISETDPDKGTTDYTYDGLDRLTLVDDARSSGDKVANVYDGLGRKIEERAGSASGTLLSSWTYDTLRKGQLSNTVRYSGSDAYTSTITQYDNLNRPTKMTVKPPASLGTNLAPTAGFLFTTSYNLDGTVASHGLPAAGGLAAETVTTGYDELGRAIKTTSNLSSYITGTSYSPTGKLLQLEYGAGGTAKRTWQDFTYTWGSQRLESAITTREGQTGIDRSASYGYDDAGNVTRLTDRSRSGVDNQCFRYDRLQRLTDAWTEVPDAQGNASCGDPVQAIVGGPAGYRMHYAYDDTGNRKQEQQYTASATTPGGSLAATRDYAYAGDTGVDAGSFKGHELASVTQTGASPFSGAARSESYGYDAVGNMTVRNIGATSQRFTWNNESQLASVDETVNGTKTTNTFVYDVDGNRLARKAADGTVTLYLPGMEVSAKGTAAATATRYYTHNGQAVAVRIGSASVRFIISDHHGTGEMQVDATTQAVALRRFTPFGQLRGTSTGTWAGDKGFVGGTKDPTADPTGAAGLTRLGARDYDPNTGRFTSVDPVFDSKDSQSWNGYAYANNNPVTTSDPTGLRPADCTGTCWTNWLKSQNQNNNKKSQNTSSGKPNYVTEVITPRHETAVHMVYFYLTFTYPLTGGEQGTVTICRICNKVAGGSFKNPGKNAGYPDVIFSTESKVYVWEVKPRYVGSDPLYFTKRSGEAQGPDQLANYIKHLKIQMKKAGDTREVEEGFNIPLLTGQNMANPRETIEARSSERKNAKGIILYDVRRTDDDDDPPPSAQPRGNAKEKPRSNWTMDYIKAGGLIIGATVVATATIVEDVGSGGVGMVDDPITLGIAGGMVRQAFALAA